MDFENFKEKFMEDIKERLALFVGSKKLLKRKEFERFISERMEIL